MKKIYTLLVLMLFAGFAFGQTYLSENFDGDALPAGWAADSFADQWSVTNSANAGGAPYELRFAWVSGDDVTHFVSPEIDLTGVENLALEFIHYLDDYSGSGYSIGVATRSAGGEWNSVWEVPPTGNMGPETVVVSIDNDDVGASDFQFCFYVDGNFYNLDYYYMDNVRLFSPYNHDVALVSLDVEKYVGEGQMEVQGTIVNYGSAEATTVDLNWQIDMSKYRLISRV